MVMINWNRRLRLQIFSIYYKITKLTMKYVEEFIEFQFYPLFPNFSFIIYKDKDIYMRLINSNAITV